jgi:MFS transporter, PPP family, 3-phenylpropionic acid transporter
MLADSSSMNALRRQFFFSFAVIGSVMPLLTVFLRQEGGFNFLQIGLAISLMNIPMLCSPALITLLADRSFDPRRILASAYACSAVVLTMLYFSPSITVTLLLFVFHGLAFVAMLPLQDGFYFSLAQQSTLQGGSPPPYPLIRVWGTAGFILPSALLYIPLSRDAAIGSILPCAVGFCLLSLANSFTLPKITRLATSGALPTKAALLTILGPNVRWLTLGLFFAFLGAACYYAFIGNYFDEVIGIPSRHIGLIINLGVLLEIGFTMLMPRLQKMIHLKGILVLGLGYMVVRMVLLASTPTLVVALATQILHGLEVLALFIGPVMFINRLARDEFRNSIQGVFTMIVGGCGRVIGGVAGGLAVTEWGLSGGLWYAAAMVMIGFILVTCFFSRIPPPDEQTTETTLPSGVA